MRKQFILFFKFIFLSSTFLIAQNATNGVLPAIQVPKTTTGTIKHFEKFNSKFIEPHNIDVWLPEGYNAKNKYAVLYMHDGKSLFDTSITWNGQEWGVDETMSNLLKEDKIRKTIVVAVWNGDRNRHNEYFPQKPFETFSTAEQDSMYKIKRDKEKLLFNSKVNSDNYLKFLVKELKPFIDKTFSTLKDKGNTFIAGSSMGGLISMYAMCEYPDVFGGAACLSTHWIGLMPAKKYKAPAAFEQYLQKNIPASKDHAFYFDYGSISLDYYYKPYQKSIDSLFVSRGYSNTNYLSKEFVGEGHAEIYWKKRLDIPLVFLLKK
jgi:enterochelin esterase-like enzyme